MEQELVEEQRAKDSAKLATFERAVRLYPNISREELERAINEWYLRWEL